ncbi:MAG TPA: HEAT repeat domain-containing protein, partial [Pyrinomonadaceae bacterium]|nr:HEAT repeat domain-containing protein [Pyrinomonadaceae bacterium]
MLNRIIGVSLVCVALSSASFAQKQTLLQIVKAEDERRWDNDLRDLLSSSNVLVRKRAALAAGRIGEEDAIGPLTNLLEKDADPEVRAMAAFALGEVESEAGANALLAQLKNKSGSVELRARTIEALGKIAAALPKEKEARQRELGAAILEALKSESNTPVVLLGLTAVLRSRPTDAGPTLAKFLTSPNARVRADAANALARLRLKDGIDQLRKLLMSDLDPVVRANAARVLGVSEDKQSVDALLARATDDKDSRVRVSAIRALASVKDPGAAEPLLARGHLLAQRNLTSESAELNEILEIATTLGRLLAQKDDQAAIAWLRKLNETLGHTAPEIDLALVRIAPATYLADFGTAGEAKRKVQETILLNWRAAAGVAAGLGEIAALPETVSNKSELAAAAQNLLRAMLDYRNSG